MKIKFKIIATAAVLALASATASATINVTSTPDLLFMAYDNLTGATYVRDLGVSLSALNSSTTFSAPANSIFASQMASAVAAGDPIQWNVVALDATPNKSNFFFTGDITQQQGITASNVKLDASSLVAQLGGLTQLDVAANGYIFPNGEYSGSSNTGDATNVTSLVQQFSFGFPTSGQGVGSSQNFLEVNTKGVTSQLALNSSLNAYDNNSAGGYFTLLDAQGDLGWTTAGTVAAVPLPAAALLFAPGLMAMFGIGRRRKNNAA